MKVLILARGGSKGVPDKNIKLLDGFPLLAYPIVAAKKCESITEVYVSTDSDKIAAVAEEYGAIVIRRPEELAQDHSLDRDAFIHATPLMGNPEEIIHLRATTPVLNSRRLEAAIKYYLEHRDQCTSMRSAHKMSESAYKLFRKNGQYWGGIFPDIIGEYFNKGRQELPGTYKPNGYIDIVKTSVFMDGSKNFHGDKILSFETPVVIEVDSIEEFEYLEYFVQKYNINIERE